MYTLCFILPIVKMRMMQELTEYIIYNLVSGVKPIAFRSCLYSVTSYLARLDSAPVALAVTWKQ